MSKKLTKREVHAHQLIFLGHVLTDAWPLNVQLSDVRRVYGVCAAYSNALPLGFLDGLRSRGRHLYGRREAWKFKKINL